MMRKKRLARLLRQDKQRNGHSPLMLPTQLFSYRAHLPLDLSLNISFHVVFKYTFQDITKSISKKLILPNCGQMGQSNPLNRLDYRFWETSSFHCI